MEYESSLIQKPLTKTFLWIPLWTILHWRFSPTNWTWLLKQAFHVKREERKQMPWIKSNANPRPEGTKNENIEYIVLSVTKDRGFPTFNDLRS